VISAQNREKKQLSDQPQKLENTHSVRTNVHKRRHQFLNKELPGLLDYVHNSFLNTAMNHSLIDFSIMKLTFFFKVLIH